MVKKTIFLFITLTLLIVLPQIPAFATSVNISVSGNRGVITITTVAHFDIDPLTDQTGGILHSPWGGYKYFTTATGTATVQYDTTLSADALTLTAWAQTYWNSTFATDTLTITLNNTPQISISTSGTLRGITEIIAHYSFPSSSGRGNIVLLIDSAYAGTFPSIPLSYFQETTGTTTLKLDTTWFSNGSHTLEAYPSIVDRFYNAGIFQGSITTHNAPEFSISPAGKLKGKVELTVTYRFPSTYAGAGEVQVFFGKLFFLGGKISIRLSSTSETEGSFTLSFDTTKISDGVYSLILYGLIYSRPSLVPVEIPIEIANAEPIIDPTKEPPIDNITTVAEPINVANGNMFLSVIDILIPSREIPLELSRTYNSQDDFNGSLGYGWRTNFDTTLEEQFDHSVIEVDEKGVYTIYTKNPDGSYKPSSGKYSQLTKNSDGTYTILRKHGRKLYFDNQGRLIKIEERNTNTINVLRTSSGIITEASDSSGRKLLFTQDFQGKIIQVEDPAGRLFKYEYDSNNGNLIKTTDPLNNETLYQYDSNHNLTRQTDANGNSLYFEYDSSDRAYHSWQDGNNNKVTLSFDPTHHTTTSTDSLGNIAKYEYNEYGLVTKITDSQNKIQTFSWDSNLNKTSSTNQNGNTTTFTYDSRGNLLTLKDPLNNTTNFTYEPKFDLVSSITDALGNKTEYFYDTRGNLTQVKDALGNTTNYTYDTSGQLTQIKDANENTTNFSYDTSGNLIQIQDALSNKTNFTFDIIGNVIQITDAQGNPTQFNYDSLNRLLQITYPDGSKVKYTYDKVGNLTSFTDPNSNITTYVYDVANHLIHTTDALGNVTQYTYDTEGNRLSIIDANLNKTQYFYDSLNRLIKTLDPLNNQTIFNYDPVGNLIAKTDANGNTVNYTYDKNNRLTQITYPDSSTVSFTYDALGRRRTMTDSTGPTNYSYDALSRLTQVDGPQTNDTISYTYDKVGNRIQMVNPDGGITNYSYDNLNRLISLTDPQGKTTTYTYDAVSNLIQMNYPNNTQANYTFDNLNRLISLTNQAGQDTISSHNYDYNPSGMRTKVTLANGDYILYSYDKLNQLIKEERFSQDNELLYAFTYSYDSVGNRLTSKIDFKDEEFKIKGFPKEATLEYFCNPDNQLTQIKVYKIEEEDKTKLHKISNYTYDQNGNLIQEITLDGENQTEEAKTFSYDYENRLIQLKITEPDENETETFDFGYDGLGRRISQVATEIEEAESETHTRSYLYDGLNTLMERDQTNQTFTTYTRGLSYGGGIGGIISLKLIDEDKEKELYYHYDGLGSVSVLTDTEAKPKITYTYDAFGNILSQKGSRGINPYTFSTKEQDKSGLIYFGARYYEPRVGRWITKDPLTWGPDDPRIVEDPFSLSLLISNEIIRREGKLDFSFLDSRYQKSIIHSSILRVGSFNIDNLHRYIYCFNNPINFIDPFGLSIEPVPIWDDPIFWAATGTTMWIKGQFIIIGRYIGRYSRPVVIGIVSKLWHWGARLDFPEIGKWFHIHWPWSKGSW